ncbi:DUF3999 family protein [Xanthomonadaceae bacterium JHOS43]|nr:DUF3999 family protein [Xanthomonadaceae bacterium JHOS43]
MKRSMLWMLLVAFSSIAPSQELRHLPPTPRDFAWQWPLAIAPGEDLVRISLTPEVYARLWRDDTMDLTVFNGAEEAVPVATLDAILSGVGSSGGNVVVPIDVPVFRTPAVGTRDAGDRLRLFVSQRSDGRLERLDADVETASMSPSPELLLDLSAIQTPSRGLVVTFNADAAPLVARVDVFGSRDLSSWTRLAAAQALVSLNEGGLKLERRRIEFADTTLPYLRLVRTDAREDLPIEAVQALRSRATHSQETPLQQVQLAGHAEADGRGFVYRSAGPFPIERIGVTLAERNAAANVIIESRPRPDLPWRERARGAVFHVSGRDADIASAPLETALVRDREWRIRTEPPQARAPAVTLGYRPDQLAFLVQGEGPFRLAAGSARSQRATFPLHVVLLELRDSRGDSWLPPETRLGRGSELAGSLALAPRLDASGSPTPWQWLLWGLLLAGAFVVVTMVLRLLRQSGSN